MRKNFLYLTILFFVFCSKEINAQDIHLSHIHASPTYLNPSMTGMINDGTIRLTANSRGQWNNVTNGYKTVVASVDAKVFGNGSAVFTSGLQLFADRAGDLDFTTIKAALTFGVIKSLDYRGDYLVSLGFQAAYVTNRLDYSKAIGLDEEPLFANGLTDKISYFDLATGASYYAKYQDYNSLYLGVSAYHLNMADVTFGSRTMTQEQLNSSNEIRELYRKFVVHGGTTVRLSRRFSIMPSMIYLDQGPHKEINMGSFLRYMKSKHYTKPDFAIYAGAWFRWYREKDLKGTDSLILSLRTDVKQTYISISYDLNVSTWKRASRGNGAAEISIIQILDPPKWSRKVNVIQCPGM